MDRELIRDELKDYYNDIKEDKFLRKNFYKYKDLLFKLNDVRKRSFEGPLRYFSYDELIEILKKYFEKYFGEFLDTDIKSYDLSLVIDYINASDEETFSDKFNDIDLSREEAFDLMISEAYYDCVLNDIKVINYNNLMTDLSISHEYAHKIHNNRSLNNNTIDFYIYSEYLAYYNMFLFADYLKELGYLSDALISLGNDYITINEQIKLFKIMDDIYRGINVDNSTLKIIDYNIDIGNVPLLDYAHIFAYLASKNKYEETKNMHLMERCKELNRMFSLDINKSNLDMVGLNIDNKELVKKYIINFSK